MNYGHIYNSLTSRACVRVISDEYHEMHHIVPRCMGGSDSGSNLVALTAREHFVAHLCLVRMYPTHHGLVKAAVMMAVGNNRQHRSKNRIYEWLKQKHSVAMSISQTGASNSQFGKVWVYSDKLRITKRILKIDLDDHILNGWKLGRVVDFDNIYQTCIICNTIFRASAKKNTCGKKCNSIQRSTGRIYEGREDEFIKLYTECGSMNAALKQMGFRGAEGQYYNWARTILEKYDT